MFRKLKAEAALSGAKLKGLEAQFIEKGLAGREPVGERRARSPLPQLRARTGVVHPSLSNAQLEDILAADASQACP